METPLVSVVIPNYNYAKYISRTVESVLRQSYENIEVIVVDDQSSDDSLSVLKKFGNRITVIAQKNQGVSMARNNGFARASGEYVAFLDADDIWLPNKIERQLEKFSEDDEFGMVHCSMTYLDKNEQPSGNELEGMEGWIAEKILKLSGPSIVGVGSTSLVRREAFENVGGFDPDLSTAADWEFSYRLAVKYKIGFVPDPLVLYRLHGSNMHANVGAMEHDVRLGFKKAFSVTTPELKAIKSECYANFHRTLAGSYLYAQNYPKAVRNAAAYVYYKPGAIGELFGISLKKLRARRVS